MSFTAEQQIKPISNQNNSQTLLRMKLLAVMCISIFTFSCSKHRDVVKPKDEQGLSVNQNVPHFDETNSTKVTWDKLPAELKNAVQIKATQENKGIDKMSLTKKNELASGSALTNYKYLIGPWGGGGGSYFSIQPPVGSRIYAMAISAGSWVDRIVVWYRGTDGTIYVGMDSGGNGGTYNVQYFSSDEYIYSVSGQSGGLLDRISIRTNRKYFSYGGWGGAGFSASVPPGYQILGFFGASGGYIDRIGFYVY